ncbi:MAG: DUF3365 domain-containing protein [Xanthomarina sp.]
MKKQVVLIGVFWLVLAGCKQTKNETNDVSDSSFTKVNYEELGMEYAMATQALLGKNLMGAINKNGVNGAVEFCNLQAYPLTDSMSVAYNVHIKRVTNKPRNSDNQVNAKELQYLRDFEKDITNHTDSKPILVETDQEATFYYPIKTNAMCLQCHGTPNKELNMEAYKTIRTLYPKDMAIGYNENEVRGLWRVNFKKE